MILRYLDGRSAELPGGAAAAAFRAAYDKAFSLDGADFSGESVKCFPGMRLEIAGASFRRCEGPEFVNFYEASLERCDFREARMERFSISRGEMDRCDFRGAALLEPHFFGAWARRCKFQRARIAAGGADALSQAVFSAAVFEHCSFRGAVIAGADMRGAAFHGCDFTGATLYKCDCREAEFYECEMAGFAACDCVCGEEDGEDGEE